MERNVLIFSELIIIVVLFVERIRDKVLHIQGVSIVRSLVFAFKVRGTPYIILSNLFYSINARLYVDQPR